MRKIIGYLMLFFAVAVLYIALASKSGFDGAAYMLLIAAACTAFLIKAIDLIC